MPQVQGSGFGAIVNDPGKIVVIVTIATERLASMPYSAGAFKDNQYRRLNQ